MATDPSGIFTLPPSTWVETGDTVLPEQHNPAMLELEQGMTDRLMRDGRAPMTGNLRMGDNKITGLADGTSPSDAAAFHQIAAAFKAWLTSVNKLDLAADEMVYAGGTNFAAKTALTGYARSLLRTTDSAAARGTLGINKAWIDGLGINATSVGGITPGQIARRDTSNTFQGQIDVPVTINVRQSQSGDNTHLWFRDTVGEAIGLIYRRGTDGALVFRRYNVAGGAFEEAILRPGGIFEAPAFQGDGSRLTNLPITKALIDGLGINASSVGGITPGQIARRDTDTVFGASVSVLGALVVRPGADGNNYIQLRDSGGRNTGMIFRNSSDGSLRLRAYSVADGAYKEAYLRADGIFVSEAFQGDGSRLTGLPPMAFGPGWNPVNVSRSENTAIHNNTPYPMFIMFGVPNSDGSVMQISHNGSSWYEVARGSQTSITSASAMVPPNWWYRPNFNSTRFFVEVRRDN